jgi:flagellar hook-associated protein 2
MTITIGGLASGLDTQSIISALMSVEQLPLTELRTKQQDAATAQSDMSSFLSTVTSLQTAAQGLEDPTGYSSYAATSSDPGVSATITGAASPGTSSVQVTQLASEQRTQSYPQSSSTDPLGQEGTVDIQVGTADPVPVPVNTTDSLTDIAANINASGAPVTASITYDGSQYYLLVRGAQTGQANAVTFTEDGTGLGLSDPASTYQSAQDANLTVDDFNVTAPSNVVTDAIPGVTLNLASLMSAAGTVTVSSDDSALATKINAFVSAYNTVVAAGQTTAGYGTTAAASPLLQGDTAVRQTMQQLSSLVTGVIPGTGGQYTTLGSVGISLNNDGTLAFDQSTLDAAIQTDPTDVAKIFTTDPTTGSTGVMGEIDSAITTLTTGTSSILGGDIAAFGNQSTEYTSEETALQTQISTYQTALQNEFTQLEINMSNIKAEQTAIASIDWSSSSSSSSSSSASSSSTSLSGGYLSTGSSSTG